MELLSTIFCLGIIRAKKYKIIDDEFNPFGLFTLVIILGSMITLLSTGLIIGLAFSLPMFIGALKSWLIYRLEN